MRTATAFIIIGVLLVLWSAPAQAQDSATTSLKPDLPLGFPTPRSSDPAEDPDETERASRARDGRVVAGKDDPKAPGTNDDRDSTPATPGGDDRDNTPTTPGGDDRDNTPTTPGGDDRDSTPTAPGEDGRDSTPTAPGEDGRDSTPTAPGEDGSDSTPAAPGEDEASPPDEDTSVPPEEGATAPPEDGPTVVPPEEGADTPPVEEGSTTPPIEEGSSTPPEEEGPRNPPPEFFDEPIEAAEVIFVIDRSGSMRWPSNMSVIDENGNPANNLKKYDVVRIELIKSISNFSENIKFAIVGFSTYTGIPVWPGQRQLVTATEENKASAIGWARARLNSSTSEVNGGTPTYDGMSVGLSMVSPPAEGNGPGGEARKSATSVMMLTDGCPTHIQGTGYVNCYVYGSYDAGEVRTNFDRGVECMALTKAKILAENRYAATIFTLGMGMNMACPHPIVGGVDMGDFGNQKCREFMTQLAESTGGYYREISQ